MKINYLTPREKAVCRKIMARRHNKQIADELRISVKTVRAHLSNIYGRFILNGKPDLVIFLSAEPRLLK